VQNFGDNLCLPGNCQPDRPSDIHWLSEGCHSRVSSLPEMLDRRN
jgi:hypothetical protein